MAIIRKTYYSCLFYGGVLLLPYSPGALAWKLFRNKMGKIPLFHRDLICDTKTLMDEPKNDRSLDERTTAFSPFIPLLTLNEQPWKVRRKILADGLRKMHLDDDCSLSLPLKKGDVYWDVFEGLFQIGFRLVFGRAPTGSECGAMYPGIVDINRIIKRHTGTADMDARWKLYHRVAALIAEKNERFIFFGNSDFAALSEVDQVSIVVEDLITSICIQCSDLICHLLLLYPSYKELFKTDLDRCIDETLRLYPLTDIWTRKAGDKERGWIASLVQLNRSGWNNPDEFCIERWNQQEHPPLLSWGFDARSCPATKIGYNLAKAIVQKIIANEKLWIEPASNFTHERTFPHGCQLWIGTGQKPTFPQWKFSGKWKNELKQWFYSRLRVLDQGELW